MTRAEVFDRDGRRITLAGNVLESGMTLRVPHMVMDTAPAGLHRPGSLPLTDADRDAREATLADRDRRVSEAWKHPAPIQEPAGSKIAPTTPADGADALHAARVHRLENAWRG